MNTTNIRPKVDKVRAMSVKKTAQVFDVTEVYVRQIIRGDAEHEGITKYYNKTYKAIQNALTA